MLDCNGDGLRAELKAHREYFQATRDQVEGMKQGMDRVIKLNGVQLKNNGTSWASKVEGKACEALKETQRAKDGFLQTEKKVMQALCALEELDSKVASCFAKAMKHCECTISILEPAIVANSWLRGQFEYRSWKRSWKRSSKRISPTARMC